MYIHTIHIMHKLSPEGPPAEPEGVERLCRPRGLRGRGRPRAGAVQAGNRPGADRHAGACLEEVHRLGGQQRRHRGGAEGLAAAQCMYIYIYTCMYVYIYIYTYTYIYLYICVYNYIYIYMLLYIHMIHCGRSGCSSKLVSTITNKQTSKQTSKQATHNNTPISLNIIHTLLYTT